ncbi:MAG: hypothetical protein ACYS21_03335, partial [Planctomycetota bacterium]
AEVIASVTIGAMVLVTMLGIYRQAQTSAAAVERKIEGSRLASEVLQRIAEDLDRMVGSGSDTKIIVQNKFEEHYPTAQLTIKEVIRGGKNKAQNFETVVWQASYDYEGDANGLVLYRSHSGMAIEDKVLDEYKEDWERALFVPICSGVTYFKVQVPKGSDLLNRWPGTSLPRGIVVTISFADPVETLRGTWEVLDEDKVVRTIAVDRTRKIKYVFVKVEEEEEEEESPDVEEEQIEGEDETGGEEDTEEEGGVVEKGDVVPDTPDEKELVVPEKSLRSGR